MKVLLPGIYRVEATIGNCRSSGLLRFITIIIINTIIIIIINIFITINIIITTIFIVIIIMFNR